MCCLYGILDYKEKLSNWQKNHLLQCLSVACEKRGTDATGIAYNKDGRMEIYKKPLPAHNFHYRVPNGVNVVMGHTRLTTQGNAKVNHNNHPFKGYCGSEVFSLAHNGVLYNENKLRKEYDLPATSIETDSYVAVQMIEQTRTFNLKAIQKMAEAVAGSFCFTLLDGEDNLYLVKGNNPLTIYHCEKLGFYIYASTDDILRNGLMKAGYHSLAYEKVEIEKGDILILTAEGEVRREHFATDKLDYYDDFWFGSRGHWGDCVGGCMDETVYGSYLECLVDYAENVGVSEEEVLYLYENGFEEEEIEALLYCPEILKECIDEMVELEHCHA